MTSDGYMQQSSESKYLFIELNGVETTPTDPLPVNHEALFAAEGISMLSGDAKAPESELVQYFAQRVARHPLDLNAHVDRVYLHFREHDEDGLYSALLDLFLALTDKGIELRTRLLAGSRSVLSPHHFAALEAALNHPVKESALPLARLSVLAKGLTGELPVMIEVVSERAKTRDPLLEAREYIEYSQLEEARQLLETSVLAATDRFDLQMELLMLYRATGNQRQWRIMREKLAHVLKPLPDEWTEFGDHRNAEYENDA